MSPLLSQDQFEIFVETVKQDTPKLRYFLVKCTRLKNSKKSWENWLTKIKRETKNKVDITHFMTECWHLMSKQQKQELAKICDRMERDTQSSLPISHRFYDGGL